LDLGLLSVRKRRSYFVALFFAAFLAGFFAAFFTDFLAAFLAGFFAAFFAVAFFAATVVRDALPEDVLPVVALAIVVSPDDRLNPIGQSKR
jgi:hypothetical protein